MKVKEIIDKIRQSKDGKVLASNFTYLSLLQVAGYIFPLITMPYLARVIGVVGFGKIAFAGAVIVWIQTVADWGFNYTATRDVAKNREDKDKVSDIFSRVFWSRCLLMVLSFMILVLLIACVPKFRENAAVILVTFLMIPGHIMFPDWFFQAMERMKYITILNVLSKLLFTILVFVFIREQDDYILQPLFVSLGFVLAGVVAMYYIVVKWRIGLRMVSLKSILQTVKSSTDVFINNLMPNLYNSFSTLLLGFTGGDVANGIFDAGRRFITIATNVLNMLSRTFYPFISRRNDKYIMYAKINISVALFFSVVLFLMAPLLMEWFFTPEFSDSIIVLRIMVVYIFFVSVQDIFGVNYMIVRGFERQLRNITAIASIIGCLLSIYLVHNYSFIGAALSVSFSLGMIAFFSFCWVVRKERSL